ncbi:MAG: hypothetical protein PF481_04320 [Bacteroidales bacterium]|jgi:hypothetical protein|nr:hypothetical protein [Bacteroidales bacterium]
MRYNILIIIFFTFSTVYGQDVSKKELNYKPINLEEAVNQLKIIHQDSTKQKIMEMSEDEFLAGAHFGLGMWIRNNWGLWKGQELAKYFNSIGIYHPDDMSGIILTSYYRELHGQDWKIDEQIQYYQDYWKKSNEHFQKLKTDTAYQKMIQEQQDSILEAKLYQKKIEWAKGKKVNGYVEHRCGCLEGLFLRTQIEGTIIEWQDDKLLLQIDKYMDMRKKKRVVKCYNVEDDLILIEHHELFRLKDD